LSSTSLQKSVADEMASAIKADLDSAGEDATATMSQKELRDKVPTASLRVRGVLARPSHCDALSAPGAQADERDQGAREVGGAASQRVPEAE
jgi:hypothetical protein